MTLTWPCSSRLPGSIRRPPRLRSPAPCRERPRSALSRGATGRRPRSLRGSTGSGARSPRCGRSRGSSRRRAGVRGPLPLRAPGMTRRSPGSAARRSAGMAVDGRPGSPSGGSRARASPPSLPADACPGHRPSRGSRAPVAGRRRARDARPPELQHASAENRDRRGWPAGLPCAAVNASDRENSTRSPTRRPPRASGGSFALASEGRPSFRGSPRSTTTKRPSGVRTLAERLIASPRIVTGRRSSRASCRDRRAAEADRRAADSIGEPARRIGREVAPPAQARELVGGQAEQRHGAAVE